jgi:hypothetical protein
MHILLLDAIHPANFLSLDVATSLLGLIGRDWIDTRVKQLNNSGGLMDGEGRVLFVRSAALGILPNYPLLSFCWSFCPPTAEIHLLVWFFLLAIRDLPDSIGTCSCYSALMINSIQWFERALKCDDFASRTRRRHSRIFLGSSTVRSFDDPILRTFRCWPSPCGSNYSWRRSTIAIFMGECSLSGASYATHREFILIA